MDIVVVLLIKQTGFIHLQCKYWQVGEAMALFLVIMSLLTACTGLAKRAGTEHPGHGCAAVQCTVNIAFPRQNFGQGTCQKMFPKAVWVRLQQYFFQHFCSLSGTAGS